MKICFTLLQASAAAMLITMTIGCAPPEPVEVDMSTEMMTKDSNMTDGSNMTMGGEAPMSEMPAE